MNQNTDFRRLLEEGFAETSNRCGSVPDTRLEYLSNHIFKFTLYDGAMEELFASKALEVCAAISDSTTFEYIKVPEQYHWFLVMVNMPFFADKLEWGVSLRGAWWQHEDTEFSSCGLWAGGDQFAEPMLFSVDQWREFIAAVRAFASA